MIPAQHSAAVRLTLVVPLPLPTWAPSPLGCPGLPQSALVNNDLTECAAHPPCCRTGWLGAAGRATYLAGKALKSYTFSVFSWLIVAAAMLCGARVLCQ